MSERNACADAYGKDSERGQSPSLATATREGVPWRSPARQGQEREG
jgi:hypothetical protein